VVDKPQQNTKV